MGTECVVRLRNNSLNFKTRQSRASALPKRRLSLKPAPGTDDNLKALMLLSGLEKIHPIRGVIGEIEQEPVRPGRPEELERFREIADVPIA